MPEYPYVTKLDVKFKPLTLIDEGSFSESVTDRWFNQTLCAVNDSVVRVGVVEGEYHWHRHPNEDEFFFVLEGELLIDLEDRTVALSPRQGFVIPKNVMHRTRALQRTVMLMVETRGIEPTGEV